MTSHSPEELICQEHGFKVPLNDEMLFIPDPSTGVVAATVEWFKRDRLRRASYSASDETISQLPEGDHLGDQVAEMVYNGILRSVHELFSDAGNGIYYRIDDMRFGHNWGYFLFMGKESASELSFRPETVYHYFEAEDEHDHIFPRLTKFEDVVAIMQDENVLLIEDVADLAGIRTDDPKAQAKWDLEDRVVIWDRGAICANAQPSVKTETEQ